VAVLVVVAGVAAAFAWPWLPSAPVGGDMLDKYVPLRDGEARLMLQELGDGSTKGWLSQSSRIHPGLRVVTDVRQAFRDAVLEALKRPGEDAVPESEFEHRLAAITVLETRVYELAANGDVTEGWHYAIRDETGDRFLGIYFPKLDQDAVADPPAMQIPSGVGVGDSWNGAGMLGAVPYTWVGRLLSVGPYDGAAGRFEDCLQVETRLTLGAPPTATDTLSRDWYCAERGWIETQTIEPDGTLTQRSFWLGASGKLAAGAPLPPVPPMLDEISAPPEPDRWKLMRLGRARSTGDTSEATILPTWLPTDPPLLLVAGFEGDLVAFETHTPGEAPRWRFHPDSTIYGQPAFDPQTGRIYFGSSDKRLYALDTRGLFLWSFQTEDNVAARPLVVGDLVVAASEDGKVYGLDARTGAQRWTFEAGDAIVSWPALVQGTVAIGSDDSTVYGLDPATGEQRWTLAAGGAVEAPIVVDESDGQVYVASRDGTLAAFAPAACTETCEAVWSVKPGGALRAAPLIVDDRIVVIDDFGQAIAVTKEDGKRLWAVGGAGLVGAPILVGEDILAATGNGSVERIGRDGARLGSWDARTAASPADGEPSFSYGPVLGGDAVWLADSSAVIRRLGAPPIDGIPALGIAWIDHATRPPFGSDQFRNTVVAHDGRAIVVGFSRGVFSLDPATGSGFKLADLPGEGVVTQLDPVVSGDTLLTISGRTMQALDLRTGQVRWQGVATGTSTRPPAVAGDTVLWPTSTDGNGALLAVDLATGTMRWQVGLGAATQIGGVVATADTVFTSTPPAAWSLQTGEQRWQVSLDAVQIGGPGLAPDGQTVYVAGIRPAGNAGTVTALDAASGAVRWQIELENGVMSPLDRLWVQDGRVVVPDLSGKVIVLDAETGAELWRFQPPAGRLGNVTVDRGRVWLMLENARLYGLDLADGRPAARLTELEMGLNGQGLTQRPTFVGDRLLYPAGMMLLGLDVPEGAR
jgi:outer membrane protein assembly factor BamB